MLVSFDCGFPLCMFSEEIPAASRAGRMSDFQNAGELRAHYAKRLSGVRRMGIFDECLTCEFIESEQCCGGCVALSLRGWDAKAIRIPSESSPGAGFCPLASDLRARQRDRVRADATRE